MTGHAVIGASAVASANDLGEIMVGDTQVGVGLVAKPQIRRGVAGYLWDGIRRHPNLVITIALFVGAVVAFMALDAAFGIDFTRPSSNPYYTYQASSWLQGRWDIAVPGDKTDLITLHGKLYSIYAPFPAVLLLPLVAMWGTGVSDILFTLVVSACNLSLLFLVLQQLSARGLTSRSTRENAVWSALLFFASCGVALTLGGTVWFTAHIVSVACTLLSLLLAFKRHYFWSAVALGCAFFSRSTLALGFLFLLFLAWHDADPEHNLERFIASLKSRRPALSAIPWRHAVSIAAVAVGTAALYLIRNKIMFGSYGESGYDILNQQRYWWVPSIHLGLFNIRYIPANFINDFLNLPRFDFTQHPDWLSGYNIHPMLDMLNGSPTGTSVFLTSPLFLLLFWHNRPRTKLQVALWALLGVTVAILLNYYTAGYHQFGTRYLFDFYPYVWVLLALSRARLDWRFVALGVLGIVVNILGAHQFWTHVMLRL